MDSYWPSGLQGKGCHDPLARSVLGTESREDRGTHTMPMSFLEKELNSQICNALPALIIPRGIASVSLSDYFYGNIMNDIRAVLLEGSRR